MKTILTTIFGTLFAMLMLLVASPFIIFGASSWGLAIATLWEWFVMPAFVNAPELSWANATGLTLFIVIPFTMHLTALRANEKPETQMEKQKRKLQEQLKNFKWKDLKLHLMLVPYMFIFIAWIVKVFLSWGWY